MFIVFFGKRGSGKTTAINGNIKYCRGPVVCVDVLGNFNSPEYIQTTSIKQCLLEVAKYCESPNEEKKVIVLKTHDVNTAVDYCSAALWEINGGTLVLDEGDSISFSEAPCFDQAVRYGRNRNIDIIFGCRRPAESERDITAAANKFYCFRTNEFRDLQYFEYSVFGKKSYELGRMQPYHGLYKDHDLNVVGVYKSDEQGNIYYLTQESEESTFNEVPTPEV